MILLDTVTVWQRAVSAELSWLAPDGPTGIPVVPLMWRSMPCVALPFAHFDAAESLVGGVAAFSVTEGGTLAESTPAMGAVGPVEVVHDTEGTAFVEHMVEAEAVKHPPTRLRAGNLIGRRENWWWVGRILISLLRIDEQHETAKRHRATDAVLVADRDGIPQVDVVTAIRWPEAGQEIDPLRPDGRPVAGAGSVFAFGHAHSPDFERWERWHRKGRLEAGRMRVEEAVGTPAEELEPFGVWDRLRNHRDVQRACRRGIARAERRGLGPL